MSIGAGNVIVQQKQQAGGGGGLIGARNGLTNNLGYAELGGMLLQDTTIDMDAQIFTIEDTPVRYLTIQPFGTKNVKLGPENPASGINYLEFTNNGNANDSFLFIHQGLGRTFYSSGAGAGVDVEFGDIDLVENGLRLQLYDLLGYFNLIQQIGGVDHNWLQFNLATGVWDFKIGDIDGISGSASYYHLDADTNLFDVYLNSGRALSLDNVRYALGDIDGVAFKQRLAFDGNLGIFVVEQDTQQAFYAAFNTGIAAVGDPLGNASGVMVRTDQINFEVAIQARGGLAWIGNFGGDITADFDTFRRKVTLGDTSGQGNNTTFKVDDNAQTFVATNMANTGSIADSPLVITAGGTIKKMPAGNPGPLAYRGGGQTTDAVTPVTILTITPADIPTDTSEASYGTIIARRQSDNKAAAVSVMLALGNEAGNIVAVSGGFYGGPQDLSDLGISLSGNVSFVTNGANQELQVTGIAATVLDWAITVTRNPVTEV